MESSPIDHPILMESLALIQQRLPPSGLHGVQQEVLVRADPQQRGLAPGHSIALPRRRLWAGHGRSGPWSAHSH